MIWGRKKPADGYRPPEWTRGLPDSSAVEDLAEHAGCIATTRISRDGSPVGYMIHSAEPVVAEDTGWQFFAGDEDGEFLDDLDSSHVFSLNTIANHDRAILPYLDAPPGTAWFRSGDEFLPDPGGVPERD